MKVVYNTCMESILVFASMIIAYAFYWRKISSVINSSSGQRSQRADTENMDVQALLRRALSTRADHTGETVEQHLITDEADTDPFQQDRWRKQLFIGALLVGLGGLVYLVLV